MTAIVIVPALVNIISDQAYAVTLIVHASVSVMKKKMPVGWKFVRTASMALVGRINRPIVGLRAPIAMTMKRSQNL